RGAGPPLIQKPLPLVLPRRTRRLEGPKRHVALEVLTGQPDLRGLVAVVGELLLQHRVDAADLRAAAGDDDVLQKRHHRIRRGRLDQRGEGRVDPFNQRVAGASDRICELESAALAADDDLDVERLPARADIGVGLLDLAHAEPRKAVVRIGPVELLVDDLVDRVAGKGDADLVLAGREIALHEADVACARPDVDEEGIDHRGDVSRLLDPGVVAKAERRKPSRASSPAFAGTPTTARISAFPEGSASRRTCCMKSRAASGRAITPSPSGAMS